MNPDAVYTFRDKYIPARMMPGIRRYIDHRILPGSFLRAVISNDLKRAMGEADEENLRNLEAFVAYFHNESPSACWGSFDKMQKWVSPREGE